MLFTKNDIINILDEYEKNVYACSYNALSKPEGRNLKKFRVAVRKLIAFNYFIRLLTGDGYYSIIKKELKKIIKDFNPIRDHQVMLKIIDKSLSVNQGLEDYKKYLMHSDDHFIDADLYYKLPKIFNRLKNYLIWQRIYIHYNFPTNEAVNRNIDKSYQTLESELNIGFNTVDRKDEESIHKLRLAVKKFRYIDEVTQKLYNKKSKYNNIEQLQDIMGKIQDISVLQKSIKNYIKSSKKANGNDIEQYYSEMANQKERQIDEMMMYIRQSLHPKLNSY